MAAHLPADSLLLLPLNDRGSVHWSLLTLSDSGRHAQLNESLARPLHLQLADDFVTPTAGSITVVLPDPGQEQRADECGLYVLTAAYQMIVGWPLTGKISAAAVREYDRSMQYAFMKWTPKNYGHMMNLVKVAWLALTRPLQ
jgi:hypothetical protein